MSSIEAVQRTAYRSPSSGRCFLTAKAAAKAEANRMLAAKYPTEKQEYDGNGYCTDGGFHWSHEDRLVRVRDRLSRLLLKRLKDTARTNGENHADQA